MLWLWYHPVVSTHIASIVLWCLSYRGKVEGGKIREFAAHHDWSCFLV